MQKKYVGGKQSYKGKSIVCFLDLLGFSNVIAEEWDNPVKNPLDTILSLKKVITDFENSNGLILNLHDEKDSAEIKYICNTRSISDSIVITVPIDEGLIIADVFFLILGMINSISRFWGMCLESGYTIRGGIDFGEIYWDNNEIIGPAFINAYSLEANTAKVSRIVCSDKFAALILDICNKMDSMSNKMLENFLIDIDGLLCLNPHILYEDSEGKECFIEIVSKLMSGKPQYIKQKYVPLQKMLKNKDVLFIPSLEDLKQYISK